MARLLEDDSVDQWVAANAQTQYVISNATDEPVVLRAPAADQAQAAAAAPEDRSSLPSGAPPAAAARRRVWGPRSGSPPQVVVPPQGQVVVSEAELRAMQLSPGQSPALNNVSVEINFCIENKTARRIAIAPRNADSALPGEGFVIPPFSTRTLKQSDLSRLDTQPWVERNLIDIREVKELPTADNRSVLVAVGCGFWAIVVLVPLGLLVAAWRVSPLYWGGVAAVLAVIGIVAWLIGLRDRLPILILTGLAWLWQSLTLITLIALAVLLPGGVAYFFGGGSALLRLAPAELPSLGLLGRLLQVTFVALVSLLPVLLYFQFERRQSLTLRQAFIRDVMLLDPHMQTTDDVAIKYGRALDEAFGAGRGRRPERFLASPLVVSTLLIMLGWILTLKLLGDPGSLQADTLYTLLIPHPTALNFAFLGGYLFAINLVFRRYVRGDLGPKAYSHITVRLLTAVLVAWAVSLLPIFSVGPEAAARDTALFPAAATATAAPATPAPEGTPEPAAPAPNAAEEETGGPLSGRWTWLLLLAAFGIGILPESGVALIHDFLQNVRWIGKIFPSLREEHPLTNLEGINLYDRARLLEEGIENIENLAHYDIVDLMLNTRIPSQRLVDLVDQAILYIHVGIVASPDESHAQVPASDLHTLRRYGIRTATDLERAYAQAARRGQEGKLLSLLDASADAPVKRLRVMLDTMRDDEWIAYVRNWRRLSGSTKQVCTLADFDDQRPPNPPPRTAPMAPAIAAPAAP